VSRLVDLSRRGQDDPLRRIVNFPDIDAARGAARDLIES
jgi:hypothetical protein